jgi:hypothetical protein
MACLSLLIRYLKYVRKRFLLHKSMKHFLQNNVQVIATLTGAVGQETFIVSAVRSLELQVLEGFEEFWIPLAIYGSAVALSATLVLAAIWQLNYWTLCIIVG